MSMVSHASGARFVNLIGGSMLSFYDWYADLPVASPQVFGDQTDVPESGDWWNAGYLIMWGSNLPVTRTPDAHWMTEARYRGQKVVAVAPDYADNVKFADEWLPASPGTDAALAMAMGHVVLKEFFVDRQTPYFTDYVKTLHRPAVPGRASTSAGDGAVHAPGKFLTAADLDASTPRARTPPSRPCCSTPAPASRWSRTARWGTATASRAWAGGTSSSATSTRCSSLLDDREDVGRWCELPRFDTPDGAAADLPRGVPVRRVGGHLVTTVFDLLLAQYGVGRDGLPGRRGRPGYDDADAPYTPAWQEAITGVPAATAAAGSAASSPRTPRSPAAAR